MLVTAIAVEDQDRLHTEPCNAVSSRLGGSAKQQGALIERLTAGRTYSDESLFVLLRLWLDEIVEDLSRNDTESRSAPRRGTA